MGTVDDIRKLIQDLVTPDLKAIEAHLKAIDETAKLRDEALAARLDALEQTTKLRIEALDAKFTAKLDLMTAQMNAQHATVVNALAIDKRLENLERQAKAAEPATV